MTSALNKPVTGFLVVLLAALCAIVQQPAESPAHPDSGYVLGPDDQIIIRAIDVPKMWCGL